ncbi:PhoH family protein [Botrimarina hoheduenensis]|uniref:PhoH-like protein n=1 Tax=Botrimarina hoheduenensis TaxID=2528000 RepID=A0A5C5W8V0_9BACT|nr:PhoH family protein [Botrimarina hoheduenensis]TWT47316.1 PhoH-like protein [Botrimarina hoheduenensis]
MIEATIPVGGPEESLLLFGVGDEHLKRIRQDLTAKIATRNGRIHLSGDEAAVKQATELFERLKSTVGREGPIGPERLAELLAETTGGKSPLSNYEVLVQQPGIKIRPRTDGQAEYLEAIRTHDLVFCVGPAGTGKTFLAVAAAVEALKERRIRKIVLVRPAVEAGESLGFLPGDLQAKINPYLRPLLDALGEMMDYDQLKRYTSEDIIEVAPLAYMRGRTLNNAFIIMDEGQNTTVAQMKMFLTRMGSNSKVVVTGDATQVDLPPNTPSGLADAVGRLDGIEGLACIRLGRADIVRHRLVNLIVNAYEEGAKRT